MPIEHTFPSPVNMNVLGRESAEAGLDSGVTSDDGLTVTFLDTDDQPLVDTVVAAYTAAMTERTGIINALNANQTFLDIANPTTAQAAAQVKALTRQINGLVRVMNRRGLLD